MARAFVFCALACGVTAPVLAGERSTATLSIKLPVPRSVLLAPDPAPAVGAGLTLRLPRAPAPDFVVRVHALREPVATLAAFETLPPQPIDLARLDATASPFAIREVRAMAAWRVTDGLSPVTADDNGNYAVRDALADYRKPRVYRPSVLNAMFVLRIDGKDDSAPFSVGGGGVAAALWKAMPQ